MPITKLKDLLVNLRASTRAVHKSVGDARARIAALEVEMKDLLNKPLAKADFLQICLASVDFYADQGTADYGNFLLREALSTGYKAQINHSVGAAFALSCGESQYVMHGLLTEGTPRQAAENILSEGMLYFLFRDQLKEAITRAFGNLPAWPYPDAQPAATYFPRLVEIEAELATLKAQETQLVEEAESLGIAFATPDQSAQMRANDEKLRAQYGPFPTEPAPSGEAGETVAGA